MQGNQNQGRRLRNITNGEARIDNIDDEDREIGIDQIDDGREMSMERLKETPKKSESYLENIRTGRFSKIQKSTVTKLMKMQEEGRNIKEVYEYNPEIGLRELIAFIHSILEKIFIFFMGVLPGLALLHVFLLNQDTTLSTYSTTCLRINQLMLFCTMVCALGGIYLYTVTRRQYRLYFRRQNLEVLPLMLSVAVKRLITMCLYIVIYILELIIHIYVTFLSARPSNTFGDDFKTTHKHFGALFALNITLCVVAIICWCILIQNTTTQTTGADIDRVFSTVSTNLFEDEVDEDGLPGKK